MRKCSGPVELSAPCSMVECGSRMTLKMINKVEAVDVQLLTPSYHQRICIVE